jgi:hypothetical protein
MNTYKSAVCIFLFISTFIINNKSTSQVFYGCPGETETYNYPDELMHSQYLPNVYQINGYGLCVSQTVSTFSIHWSGGFDRSWVRFFDGYHFYSSNYDCYRIWADFSITSSSNITSGLSGGTSYPFTTNITYENGYVNSTNPNITWYLINPETNKTIVKLRETGMNIDFRPYDYLKELQDSGIDLSKPANVVLQASFPLCHQIKTTTLPLKILPEPIKKVTFTSSAPTCDESEDGKITITSFYLDNVKYENTPTIPPAFLLISLMDTTLDVPESYWRPAFEDPIPITHLPFEFNKLPSNKNEGENISYCFHVERSFDGINPSGIYDTNDPNDPNFDPSFDFDSLFDVNLGPRLTLTSTVTIQPLCYNSNAEITLNENFTNYNLFYNVNSNSLQVPETHTLNISRSQNNGQFRAIHRRFSACEYIADELVHVEFPPEIKIDNYKDTYPSCYDSNDGTVYIEASGGTGSLSYGINGSNFVEVENGNYTYTHLTRGVYQCNIRDENSCTVYHATDIKDIYPLVIYRPMTEKQYPTTCNSTDGSIKIYTFGGSRSNANELRYTLYSGTYPNGTILSKQNAQVGVYSYPSEVVFDNLCDGEYYITVDDGPTSTCSYPEEDLWSGQISLTLARPNNIVVPKKDATCPNGQGSLTIESFDFGARTFTNAASSEDLEPFTFLINDIEQTGLFDIYNRTSGNYNLQIRYEENGCLSDALPITINAPLRVALINTDSKESCSDKDNGSISISSQYGNTSSPVRQYTLTGNGITRPPIQINTIGEPAVFDLLPAGNYQIVVNDNCLEGNNTAQINVGIDNYAQIESRITTEPIQCDGESSGQLTVSANSGMPDYTITLMPNNLPISGRGEDVPVIFDNLSPGVYSIRIDDANGCTRTFIDEAVITNPDPIVITSNESTLTHVICYGDNGGIIPIEAKGGTNQLSFSTDNINFFVGNSNSTGYNYTFEGLTAGTYTVYVRDENSCIANRNYTILQPAEYRVSDPTIVQPVCHGGSDGSLTVSATGGTPDGSDYIYNLMDADNNPIESITDPTATFNGLSTGNYRVEIIDNKDCPLQSNIFLGQPNSIEINYTKTSADCYDSDDIRLNAIVSGGTVTAGPYTYLWKDIDDNIIGVNDFVDVLLGTYLVSIKDGNGCGYGRTVAGLEPFPFKIEAKRPDPLRLEMVNKQDVDYYGLSNGSVCLDAKADVQENELSILKYSIDGVNYQNMPVFMGLPIGNYTFYVQDGSKCNASITTTITQPDPFIVGLNSVENVKCFGGKDGKIILNATGGLQPYYFILTNSNGDRFEQDNNVFENLPGGIYSATVGYRSYTEIVNDINVTQPIDAVSWIIEDYQQPHCTYSDGWASIISQGGTGSHTYLWSNGQTSNRANNLSSGNYSVVISDNNNCKNTAYIALYDIDGPQVSVTSLSDIPCSYSPDLGSISLNISGGQEPYNVQWNNNQTGATASNLAPGSYSAVVNDSRGCSSTIKDIPITRPQELIVQFDDFKDPECFGGNNGEIYASAKGGNPPYKFNWTDINISGSSGYINNLSAGNYNLLVTDGKDCSTNGNFAIKNPSEINIDIPDIVYICEGQTVKLDAGNLGSFYNWASDIGLSSQNQTITVNQEGNYSITVTNVQGCSASKQFSVKHENRQFNADFMMAPQGTMADTIVLIEISWPVPDSVKWSFSTDLIKLVDQPSYQELIPTELGEYTITMNAYMSGCNDVVSKTINILPANENPGLKNAKDELIQAAKLFPNPNSGIFEVEISLLYKADININVFSMNGIRVTPVKHETGKKDYLAPFNLRNLQPGTYFVYISAGNEMKKLKFIVNN